MAAQITEYAELEGTHKNHRVQFPALHGTTRRSHIRSLFQWPPGEWSQQQTWESSRSLWTIISGTRKVKPQSYSCTPCCLSKCAGPETSQRKRIFHTFCTWHHYSNLAVHPNSKLYDSDLVEDTESSNLFPKKKTALFVQEQYALHLDYHT